MTSRLHQIQERPSPAEIAARLASTVQPSDAHSAWLQTRADCVTLLARVAALESALRPFAALAELYDIQIAGSAVYESGEIVSPFVHVQDVRAARAVLTEPSA